MPTYFIFLASFKTGTILVAAFKQGFSTQVCNQSGETGG